jgi:integrase
VSTPTLTFLAAVDRHYAEHWAGTKDGRRSRARALEFVSKAVTPETAPVNNQLSRVFTRAFVFAHRDALRDSGASAGTVNRAVAAFCSVWRSCFRRGEVPVGPPEGLYLRESGKRTRVVDPGELELLIAHLPPAMGAMARLLAISGLRVSEALALTVGDLKGRDLTVRDSKNGDARVVPTPGKEWPTIDYCLPVESMMGQLEHAEVRLFPFTQSQFNHAWALARDLAGLDAQVVPHALRHTRCTELVNAGVPLPIVAKIMGHRNIRTTMRYTHPSSEDCAAALRKAGLL